MANNGRSGRPKVAQERRLRPRLVRARDAEWRAIRRAAELADVSASRFVIRTTMAEIERMQVQS